MAQAQQTKEMGRITYRLKIIGEVLQTHALGIRLTQVRCVADYLCASSAVVKSVSRAL